MALDFQALYTEAFARGFSDLNDAGTGLTRMKRFVNAANWEIDAMFLWPYLLTSTTGTAPLTVADLRTIESVVDTSADRVLWPQDRRTLIETYRSLSTTGSPEWFYMTNQTTVGVFPANTSDSLTVRYWKFTAEMSATSDVPLMPDRYREAIVEFAVAKALRSLSNYEAADAARQAGLEIVERMRLELIDPQVFSPVAGVFYGDDT